METYKDTLQTVSASYIRDYAYRNGSEIYRFMDQNNVGYSVYGRLMDSAAKGKGVIAHRLYGHHILYDFPVNNLSEAAPFLEHLFSDLFTKQGLPILPGELLENMGMLKCCDSIRKSWNFVNGFDILAGTVAIYQGMEDFHKMFVVGMSIDSFEDVARTIGIGALELAIAISTANPFLLVGGILSLTSGLKGLMNEGAVIYFAQIHKGLTIEFSIESLSLEAYRKRYSLEHSVNQLSLDVARSDLELPYRH